MTAILAAVGLIGWLRNPQLTVSQATEVAYSVPPPTGMYLAPVGSLTVDRISPDGSRILFRASDGNFHVRRLNSLESEVLPNWRWRGDAFWAPNSQAIAFPTEVNRLMKMRLPKGAQELVAENLFAARGGTWSEKGTILFSQTAAGLSLVPSAGGTAQSPEIPGLKEGSYFNPDFLPGGEDFLITFVPSGSEGTQVYLATLRGGKAVNPQLGR